MQQYREGQRLQGSDGNIYVVRNGVPTLANAPATGPAIGNNPLIPGQLQGQTLNNQRTNQLIRQDNATAPFDYRKAAADAAKAEADARAAEAKAREDADTAKKRGAADQSAQRELAVIIQNLDKLQSDATDNMFSGNGFMETGGSGAIFRDLPGSAAYDLNARIKNIQGAQLIGRLMELKSQSDTGATGFGSLTGKEVDLILSSISNLDPNQSQEQFLESLNQAREAALAGYRVSGGKDPKIDPQAAPKDEQQNAPGMDRSAAIAGAPAAEQRAPATQYRDEVDPILKGVAGRVGQMMSAGASDTQILEMLRRSGVNPADTSINEALRFRRSPEFIQWKRANPGAPYPVGANFYTKQVPMTASQRVGNAAAQSAPGAYAIGAANALTGNRLDNAAGFLGGDPEAINIGVDMSRANSPIASFAGDAAGQALFDASLGRFNFLGKLGKGRELGQDLVYGAFAGSGDDQGALAGALTNASGGVLGRRAAGVGGALLRGVDNPNLRYLYNQGVDLTPGRIARGYDGPVADTIARAEERGAGLPLFESIINTARRDGDVSFNQAAYRQAGSPVGAPYAGAVGEEGLGQLRNVKSGAYSFLDPINIPINAPYAGAQAGVRSQIPGLVDLGDKVSKTMDKVDGSFVGGEISGPRFQQSLRTIRSARTGAAKENFGYEAADLLTDAEGNLFNLANSYDPSIGLNLGKANEVYRNYKTINDAVSRPGAQANEQIFSAKDLNAARMATQKRLKLDPNSPASPFYDLTKAGLDVMPNISPNSGTVAHAIFAGGLGGAGLFGLGGAGYGAATDEEGDTASSGGIGAAGGAALGMGIPALVAGLYSKPVRGAIAKSMLAKRPQALTDTLARIDSLVTPRASDNVIKSALRSAARRSKSGGMFGSALARDLLLYPELYVQ